MFYYDRPMATLSPDVTAAMATLQARWGAAAPRVTGAATGATSRATHGALALADPIEAWIRCGPASARDTIVHGAPIVRDGRIVAETTLDEMLRVHDRHARRIQQLA